ncbi:hypothetical protein [Saccharomonospora sp.]|uniref:hypothetical protein n=1 Tax=Saccharomonospora sp. TaxID=33913 RepID=UPI002626B9AF|nr:hypothetical protein [Saccharomonospora sp.]
MIEQPQRPTTNRSLQELAPAAFISAMGIMLLVVVVLAIEPTWLRWLVGIAIGLSEVAFWALYLTHRRKRRATQ